MDVIIEKDEIEKLIKSVYDEGEITTEEKEQAYKDLENKDFIMYAEDDYLAMEFNNSVVSVSISIETVNIRLV